METERRCRRDSKRKKVRFLVWCLQQKKKKNLKIIIRLMEEYEMFRSNINKSTDAGFVPQSSPRPPRPLVNKWVKPHWRSQWGRGFPLCGEKAAVAGGVPMETMKMHQGHAPLCKQKAQEPVKAPTPSDLHTKNNFTQQQLSLHWPVRPATALLYPACQIFHLHQYVQVLPLTGTLTATLVPCAHAVHKLNTASDQEYQLTLT